MKPYIVTYLSGLAIKKLRILADDKHAAIGDAMNKTGCRLTDIIKVKKAAFTKKSEK